MKKKQYFCRRFRRLMTSLLTATRVIIVKSPLKLKRFDIVFIWFFELN